MTELQIRKDRFSTTRIVETSIAGGDLAEGEVLAKVDHFAVTANNITYAATGDRIGYWQFFPPASSVASEGDGDTAEWGLMPVWGFAEVIASKAEDVPVGERLFGYWPPATHLKIKPVHVSAGQFFDGATHRSHLPAGYNIYRRVNAEPGYDQANDALRMLLWPLHVTSFCLWDVLQDNDWYNAKQVIIVSASSKTSIGLAYALDGDNTSPPVVGITSPRNRELVESLGLYDTSVTYDDLERIDNHVPSVIVDMSGNGEVLGRLHAHLGDHMIKTINVGLTHWDQAGPTPQIIAERSEFFFAPSHIQQRMKDWGPQGFADKSSTFLSETASKSGDWLKLKKLDGLQGLDAIFDDVCTGRIPPDQGLIVEL